MNEGSLLKRTLVTTGLLVGISAAWITLVSVTLVTAVDHAVSSGSRPAPAVIAPATPPEAGSAVTRKPQTPTPPARGTTPNG